VQASTDGELFKTIRQLELVATRSQKFEFEPVRARSFRLLIEAAFDPLSPDMPRSVQISEINFLDSRDEPQIPPVPHVGRPMVSAARAREREGALEVSYQRLWGGALRQYVTVVSTASNATVYLSAFQSQAHAEVKIGPEASMRIGAPQGFERPIRRVRGRNWLNLSDHLAFVSADPVPRDIPADGFSLTAARTWQVRPGEWFAQRALVVYACQPTAETRRVAPRIEFGRDRKTGEMLVRVPTPAGEPAIEAWLEK
jgi:hypothetical protein